MKQSQRVVTARTDQVLITDLDKLLYLKGNQAQTLTGPIVDGDMGATPGFYVDVYNAGSQALTFVPRAGQTVQGGASLTVDPRVGVRLTHAPGGTDWILFGG
jgi:hypothetical protein